MVGGAQRKQPAGRVERVQHALGAVAARAKPEPLQQVVSRRRRRAFLQHEGLADTGKRQGTLRHLAGNEPGGAERVGAIYLDVVQDKPQVLRGALSRGEWSPAHVRNS